MNPAGQPSIHTRRAWLAGLKKALPLFIAVGVWGFVTGMAMHKAGLSTGTATVFSLLAYSGTAQLMVLPLLMTLSPLWLIFIACIMVNLRFVIFGAAFYPYFCTLPWWRRFVAGYFSSDIAFVLFMSKFGDARQKSTRFQHWYYTGIVGPAWLVWQIPSILGIYVGEFIPDTWGLGFAATLALLAILVPLIKGRPMLLSITAACVAAWIGQLFPMRSGLIFTVIVGLVVGIMAERYQKKGLP